MINYTSLVDLIGLPVLIQLKSKIYVEFGNWHNKKKNKYIKKENLYQSDDPSDSVLVHTLKCVLLKKFYLISLFSFLYTHSVLKDIYTF